VFSSCANALLGIGRAGKLGQIRLGVGSAEENRLELKEYVSLHAYRFYSTWFMPALANNSVGSS
jgi:hypothetical protein